MTVKYAQRKTAHNYGCYDESSLAAGGRSRRIYPINPKLAGAVDGNRW
jgi:hypothetical protein